MRIVEAIDKRTYTGEKSSPMLDPLKAGQDGFMPEYAAVINGNNYEQWINNAAYVSRNVVPIVIRTPEAFNIIGNKVLAKRLKEVWVAMMTYTPLTIDGLNATVTLETVEHRLGASGEMQEEFVKAARARSELTKTYNEKLGKPFNRFLDFLIRYMIMDPDTQSPLITTLELEAGKLEKGEIYTPDYWTGTMLYIEPDLINKNVVEAYLRTNIAPTSAGEVTSKRDLSTGGEMKEYSITFTGITLSNERVRTYAQQVLDRMSVFDLSPDKAPLFINAAEAKAAAELSTGFNRAPISDTIDSNKVTAENSFNQ